MRPALLSLFAVVGAACGTATMDAADAAPGGVTASFASLYGDYLGNCKNCHAPGAPGRTSDIEQSLDFSTKMTAYTTLKGTATGLTGNHMDCNGTPFLAAMAKDSLLFATLDQATRQAFDLPAPHAMCDEATISDETVKVGVNNPPSAAFIAALRDWINAGALNN
jgi:hypothetical protein